MQPILNRLTPKKAILLIILIGFLVYFNTLFNGFVWDDEEEIVNNPVVHSLANIGQIYTGGTFNSGGAGLSGWFFRPARTFIIMVLYSIWGSNAFGFHLFQIILHIINAILVFKILSKLLDDSKYKITLSAILASIFVVHPALTEAVDYIAAASEVMLTFFNLLAFYLIIGAQGFNSGKLRLWLVGILLLLGMLIKESSVVIYPILVLYLYLFKVKNGKKWAVVILTSLVIYLLLRFMIVQNPIRPLQLSPISEAGLSERLLTVPMIVFSYLRLSFYPSYLAISQHFIAKSLDLYQFIQPLILDLIFFLGSLGLAIKFKSKLIFFGLFWFAAGLAPLLNIFPLDMTIGERWLYFPILGLILALTALFNLIKSTKVSLLAVSLVLIIPILSVRTIVRNSYWVNGLTLYSHDLEVNKDSFDIENNLGVELFRSGKTAEAKPHFIRSLELNPKWYFAQNNLGAVYEREKNYQEAKKSYEKVLKTSDYYLAHENLAGILLFHESTQSAQTFIQGSLKKLPNNPRLWLYLAIADYQLGKIDEALEAAKKAYLLSPNEQNYYVYSRLSQNQPFQF